MKKENTYLKYGFQIFIGFMFIKYYWISFKEGTEFQMVTERKNRKYYHVCSMHEHNINDFQYIFSELIVIFMMFRTYV